MEKDILSIKVYDPTNPLAGFSIDQLKQELTNREILSKYPEPSRSTIPERESRVHELVINTVVNHGTDRERQDFIILFARKPRNL